MARLTKSMKLEPVIDAARRWIQSCLIGDGSVFSNEELWTPGNVAEVRSAFVDHPDLGKDNFGTKLKRQMEPASPSAQRLMAEMVWALLLFPSNINTSRKRLQVSEAWSWSGERLDDDLPMLSDEVLSGIGSGGPGIHNHRWREMVFLISLVENLKKRSSSERQNIFSDYDSFIEWITQVPQLGNRQFRHMLRFFSFPDRVERMSSNGDRRAVLKGFGIATKKELSSWTDEKLDESLLRLRHGLEEEMPGQVLDFYEPPLRERWSIPKSEEEKEEKSEKRRFWVEKTHVTGRPDREGGDNALGKSLWSPQTDIAGKKIYRAMTEAQPGDVVFHLVNDDSVESFSIIDGPADSSFIGIKGTQWEGRPAYRIPLREHEKINPPINRTEFFEAPRYRNLVAQLRKESKGLFFNKNFNLSEGKYLTEAPLKMVQIWNDIHIRNTGHPLRESWNIPPLEETEPTNEVPEVAFDSDSIALLLEAIGATQFRLTKQFLTRFVSSLLAKPFVILTGNSGTGKTKLAELFVRWLCRNSAEDFALVPVGADWTDNRNVLGFVNHLRSTKIKENGEEVELPIYQSTRILDLLLSAARKEHEAKPHFLILDEMNLSHVERYFADFLSALESKEGELLLHREGRPLPRTTSSLCDVPEILNLPRNLFVIGTVNVDETTYMFSPKVLDRANVLEFRVGKDVPEQFLKAGGQSIAEIIDSPLGIAEGFLKLSFRARSMNDSELTLVIERNTPSANSKHGLEKCQTTISQLFAIMQKRNQEFAFRSMSEILRFLAVDYELVPQDEEWNWQRAMDAQILQKILPKLHGSKRKIGSLLSALAKYCEQGVPDEAESFLSDETKAEGYLADGKREEAPVFRDSYRKLCEMIEVVRRDQFVSFIQ